jgi:hypothetical protein
MIEIAIDFNFNQSGFLASVKSRLKSTRNKHGHSYGPCSTVHEILIEIDTDRCRVREWLMNIHIHIHVTSFGRDVTARLYEGIHRY